MGTTEARTGLVRVRWKGSGGGKALGRGKEGREGKGDREMWHRITSLNSMVGCDGMLGWEAIFGAIYDQFRLSGCGSRVPTLSG